jgi:hypothetical protein
MVWSCFEFCADTNSRVVEDDVDTTEDLNGLLEHGSNLLRVGDVQLQDEQLGWWVLILEIIKDWGCAERRNHGSTMLQHGFGSSESWTIVRNTSGDSMPNTPNPLEAPVMSHTGAGDGTILVLGVRREYGGQASGVLKYHAYAWVTEHLVSPRARTEPSVMSGSCFQSYTADAGQCLMFFTGWSAVNPGRCRSGQS